MKLLARDPIHIDFARPRNHDRIHYDGPTGSKPVYPAYALLQLHRIPWHIQVHQPGALAAC